MSKSSILAITIFSAIAVFLVVKAATLCFNIYQMNDWIPYEAQLIKSRLDIDQDNGDDVDTYRNLVTYQYQIDGKMYTGERLGFGYIHSNVDRHAEAAEKLKYARKIKIWVDPNKPSESSIIHGWSETALFFIIFTFLWTCGAMGSILWEWNSKSYSNRIWSKILITIAITSFIFLLGRIILAKYNDDYVIKLEDKIEVTEFMSAEEIEGEKRLEEALKNGNSIQKTIRLKYDKKTDSFIEEE